MNSNSRFTIAIHILAMLALNPDRPLSSDFVANSVNSNPVIIRRLFSLLAQAGLIETRTGAAGGALLLAQPATLTLWQVYHLVNRDTSLFALHPNVPNAACGVGRNIQPVLQDIFTDVEHALMQQLSSVTLRDVAERIRQRHGAR
jgi:Rrf2 family protein